MMNKEASTIDQIIDFLDNKKKILLMGHARIDCDALGSVLSMYMALKALNKEVTAVCSDPLPDVYEFLPTTDVLRTSLGNDDFIIALDCSKTPLDKIKYNLVDNKVNIVVTPRQGRFGEQDVSFSYGIGGADFDAIMIFDCGDLEQLGRLYEDNVQLFYDKPVINIDHHASNNGFGTMNLVNPVAAATTEILYEVLQAMEKRYEKQLITPDVATLLLAGIITDTGSFQHANTSPKSMEIAARLLDDGARQQEIIRHIYKTKNLSTLKLWGIVLSKIQVDPVYRMVWSTVSKEDLAEAEATSDETATIIDDLLINAPGAEVVFLTKENEDGIVSTSLRTMSPQIDGSKIAGLFGGGGHVRAAGFKIRDGRSVNQVMPEIIEKIRQFQAERLNIHPNGVPADGDRENAAHPAQPQKKPASAEASDFAEASSDRPVGKPVAARAPVGTPAAEKKPTSGKKETYLEFGTKGAAPSSTPKDSKLVREFSAGDKEEKGANAPGAAETNAPMGGDGAEPDRKRRKRKRKKRRNGDPSPNMMTAAATPGSGPEAPPVPKPTVMEEPASAAAPAVKTEPAPAPGPAEEPKPEAVIPAATPEPPAPAAEVSVPVQAEAPDAPLASAPEPLSAPVPPMSAPEPPKPAAEAETLPPPQAAAPPADDIPDWLLKQ